ncbi:hypothetical protein ACLBWW_20195 [Bacillus sp. M5A3_1b]
MVNLFKSIRFFMKKIPFRKKRDHLRTELFLSAVDYFNAVYKNAGSTQETAIVKSMHKNFLDLKREWEGIYDRYTSKKLFMFSNFTHGHPRIKRIGTHQGCELGDLMFIHIDYNTDGSCMERALLYQVKTTSGDSKNEEQDILYSKWPEFKFTIPDIPKYYDVKPKQPHKGARYLYVENTKHGLDAKDRYRTKELRDDTNNLCFIEELVDLLSPNDLSGRLLNDDTGWKDTINVVKDYCSTKNYKGAGSRTLGLLRVNESVQFPIVLNNSNDDGMLIVYLITANNISLLEQW